MLKKPVQCHLWQKEDLTGEDFDFEVVEQIEESSHFDRSVLRCRRCGQLYFRDWYEEVDWKEGHDRIYETYYPVSENDVNEMRDKRPLQLSFYFPRLLSNWDGKIKWVGK